MNTRKHNTEGMMPYKHRGVTYFLDDETFYTEDGIAIGYVSRRYTSYVAQLLDDDLEPVMEGSSPGVVNVEGDDLDDLLAMFEVYQETTT